MSPEKHESASSAMCRAFMFMMKLRSWAFGSQFACS
jgi:hypothetical protein